MKRILLLAILSLCFSSCADDDGTLNEGVQLRIENISDYSFESIVVASGGPEVDFGQLPDGEISGYKSFDSIYRYGYIRILIDGEETVLQPIDYVGETQYTRGKYTYRINVDDPSDPFGVSLEFQVD